MAKKLKRLPVNAVESTIVSWDDESLVDGTHTLSFVSSYPEGFVFTTKVESPELTRKVILNAETLTSLAKGDSPKLELVDGKILPKDELEITIANGVIK